MILANTHKAITKHLLCARLCSGIDMYMSMCVYAILLTATLSSIISLPLVYR